jgi:hypothetical protein
MSSKQYACNFNETIVHDDAISITPVNLLAKYVWFGRLFHLVLGDKQLYIPANNQNWRWVLDKDLTIHSSTLKLYHDDKSLSYLAIHYNNEDPAPHPVNYTLNVPEFLGTYLTMIVEDSGCRVKNIIHPLKNQLELDKYLVTFTKIKNSRIEFDIVGV